MKQQGQVSSRRRGAMAARRSGPTAIGSRVGTPDGCSAAGSKANGPHARRLSEHSRGYGVSKAWSISYGWGLVIGVAQAATPLAF